MENDPGGVVFGMAFDRFLSHGRRELKIKERR